VPFFKDLKIYFNMMFHYKPKKFWNELLSNSFDLRGVGHFRMSNEDNERMYEKKKGILETEIKKIGITITSETEIIEVGCGVGYWTEYLKTLGAKKYTGNDIAQVSVSNLQKLYPDYNFIHGDISEVELKQNKFDLGLMIDVTQHITNDKKFNIAMNNLWNSLKKNGYLIITMWDPGKNVYLTNKLRLNRIEKPRGIESYMKVFGNNAELLTKVDFNDKFLLIIKKH
jgi:SAM-dependent methyltransferase